VSLIHQYQNKLKNRVRKGGLMQEKVWRFIISYRMRYLHHLIMAHMVCILMYRLFIIGLGIIDRQGSPYDIIAN